MKLFKLEQHTFWDFTHEDKANTMLVFAENHDQARVLAVKCESEERECGQDWSEAGATCEEVDIAGAKAEILLVS